MSLLRAYVRSTYGIDLMSSGDEEEKAVIMFHLSMLEARRRIICQPVAEVAQRRRRLGRDRILHDAQMMKDFFIEGGTYTPRKFKKQLGMKRDLFLKVLGRILEVDEEWRQQPDRTGMMGHSPHMKMVDVMKYLCRSTSTDSISDYTCMGETTIYYYLKTFCSIICNTFGERYLRYPTTVDVKRLLAENAERGFPGMLGSLDGMQWLWKNCPVPWRGTYKGERNVSHMMLEVIASHDLWFWHVSLGMPESNNDPNMLSHSPLLDNILNGVAPPCDYVINGNDYQMGYFLADGIYPKLPTVVQAYKVAFDIPDRVMFNEHHKANMKDAKRAFEVFQERFRIVGSPCKNWKQRDLNLIMKCCIILHNMIIEHERRDEEWAAVVSGRVQEPILPIFHHSSLINAPAYHQLRADLVEHIKARPGRLQPDLPSRVDEDDSEYEEEEDDSDETSSEESTYSNNEQV